jgi:hypothetical protein
MGPLRSRLALATAVSFLLACAPASAAAPIWDAPQKIRDITSLMGPSVAAFSDGSAVAVAGEPRGGDDGVSVLAELPAGGGDPSIVTMPNPAGGGPRLAADPSGFAWALFPDPDGALRVATRAPGGVFGAPAALIADWWDYAPTAVAGTETVTLGTGYVDGLTRLLARFGAPGTTPEQVVGPPLGDDLAGLAIALTPGGEVTAAWLEGGWDQPKAVRVAIGTREGFGQPATLRSAVDAANINAAAAESGGAAIIWDESLPDGVTHELVGTTRRPGAAFVAARAIDRSGDYFGARLAAGGARAALIWERPYDRARLSTADLGTDAGFGAPIDLGVSNSSPSVDVSPAGEVLAVWSGNTNNTRAAWSPRPGAAFDISYVVCQGGLFPLADVSLAANRHAALIGWGNNADLVVARTAPERSTGAPKCAEPSPPAPPVRMDESAFPAPRLIVPRKLRLDRKGRFKVRVGLFFPAAVSATGYVKLKGLKSRLGLKKVRRRMVGPGGDVLTFAVYGREARALARRHRRGGKARVTINISELMGPRHKPTRLARTLSLGRSR